LVYIAGLCVENCLLLEEAAAPDRHFGISADIGNATANYYKRTIMKKITLSLAFMIAATNANALDSCYVRRDHTALLTTPINKRVVAYVKKDEQIFLLGEMNYDFDTNDDWWLIGTNRPDNNADGWLRRSSLMHCVRGTHADEYTEGKRK
jgi:hypothetical protein